MHLLTYYAGQISLCHAKIEKISKNIFVMINKDGGGQFLDFMGGHSCYEGDIELMGVPQSPTRENPAHILMVMSSDVTNTLSIPTV